jgi:hypothetical protein
VSEAGEVQREVTMNNALVSGEKRDEHGRFVVPPVSPGRPIGARNKLGEAFIQALQQDFEEHGIAAVVKVREDQPAQYLKVIASLMPKEHRLSFDDQYDGMTDAELAERIRQQLAHLAPFLDAGIGSDDAGTVGETRSLVAPGVH